MMNKASFYHLIAQTMNMETSIVLNNENTSLFERPFNFSPEQMLYLYFGIKSELGNEFSRAVEEIILEEKFTSPKNIFTAIANR